MATASSGDRRLSTLAQGMNTGIRDMINLGWKLVCVIHGTAPMASPDTYEQDRRPVMRDVRT